MHENKPHSETHFWNWYLGNGGVQNGDWPNRKERRRLGLRGRNYLAEMRGLR